MLVGGRSDALRRWNARGGHGRIDDMSNDAGAEPERTEPECPGPEVVHVEAATTAVVGSIVPADQITEFFDQAFSTIPAVLAAQGVAMAGAAFALYRAEPAETMDLEVGLVTDRAVRAEGEVRASMLPGGEIARYVHHGGYDGLGASWELLGSWIAESGLKPGGPVWEVYLTEPSPEMNPAELLTELNWPLQS